MNSDKPTILPSCVGKYISFDGLSQIRLKKTKPLVNKTLGASERIRLRPLIRYSKYQIEDFLQNGISSCGRWFDCNVYA